MGKYKAIKSNEKVTEKKQKKVKIKKERSEIEENILRFGILLLIIVALVVAFYFVTTFVGEDKEVNENNIQYDEILVGMILNRSNNSYMVLVYDSSDASQLDCSTLFKDYKKLKKEKIYYVDLADTMNSNFKTEENSNLKVDKVTDLLFSKETLLIVKDGKIENSIEGLANIKKILK